MTTIATIVMTINATTGVTTEGVIVVTTSAITAEMIYVIIDTARTTTTATTATVRSDLHHHHLKGATVIVHFNQPIERSTSSSVAAKRPKATGNSEDQERPGGRWMTAPQ
jgi:hypothetical protein